MPGQGTRRALAVGARSERRVAVGCRPKLGASRTQLRVVRLAASTIYIAETALEDGPDRGRCDSCRGAGLDRGTILVSGPARGRWANDAYPIGSAGSNYSRFHDDVAGWPDYCGQPFGKRPKLAATRVGPVSSAAWHDCVEESFLVR